MDNLFSMEKHHRVELRHLFSHDNDLEGVEWFDQRSTGGHNLEVGVLLVCKFEVFFVQRILAESDGYKWLEGYKIVLIMYIGRRRMHHSTQSRL